MQNVKQNTESAEQVDAMLETFNSEMHDKKRLVENVTETMNEIFDSSKKIDNIVNVINDISFQTNLLALNAAVEAARAGEAGRGFAVVATEVRNLAQKTAESSKSIQEIVTNNVTATQKGMELVKETSDFFNEIIEILGELVNQITYIADRSKEQKTGIEQINEAIMQMDSVINRNASLVEELSASGKRMQTNSLQLQELVKRFKVE
jgi:methyl-accepting chemotaxis protein